MRQINVYFEEEDYQKLILQKNGETWRDFILQLIKEEEIENSN